MIIKGKTFIAIRRSPTGCVWSRNLNNEVVEAPAGLLRHKKKQKKQVQSTTVLLKMQNTSATATVHS